jgi:hypothetical protein
VLPALAMATEPATARTFTKDIAPIFQTKCQDCTQAIERSATWSSVANSRQPD